MLTSMTGFGRSEILENNKQFTVEIKTVNNRYMDFHIRMPRSFSFLEERVRQVAKKYISRGRIEIYINYKNVGESNEDISVDLKLANSYLDALEKIHTSLGLEKDIAVSTIASFPEVIQLEKEEEDEEILWALLEKVLENALESLVKMRRAEGDKLEKDLTTRLNTLETLISKIEDRSPDIVKDYKERLDSRLDELLGDGVDIDENRIALEIAFFADKSSITEEIVRLHSHIDQFRNSILKGKVVGRKMDFIIQEMNREINTIGSKANDLLISNTVVEVKSELEKIREQVQNIE